MLLNVAVTPALDGLASVVRTSRAVFVVTDPKPNSRGRFILHTYLRPEERAAVWDYLWSVYDGLTPLDGEPFQLDLDGAGSGCPAAAAADEGWPDEASEIGQVLGGQLGHYPVSYTFGPLGQLGVVGTHDTDSTRAANGRREHAAPGL